METQKMDKAQNTLDSLDRIIGWAVRQNKAARIFAALPITSFKVQYDDDGVYPVEIDGIDVGVSPWADSLQELFWNEVRITEDEADVQKLWRKEEPPSLSDLAERLIGAVVKDMSMHERMALADRILQDTGDSPRVG